MDSAMKIYGSKSGAMLTFQSMINGDEVDFYAFMTSFSQNFTSTWNKESVYGRADPIGTFQGTERTISLGWDIPGGDVGQAIQNLSDVGSLIKMLYPAYSTSRSTAAGVTVGVSALSLSRSPLVKLKYGNLIADSEDGGGLLGWINSISWTPVIEMGMFTQCNLGDKLYPKVISLTLDFNVLHEHDLGTGPSGPLTPASFPFGG